MKDSGNYDNPYFYNNVYGHALTLLSRHVNVASKDCVHLDFGCGYARIAEPLIASLGMQYVGFDHCESTINAVKRRGVSVHLLELDGSQEFIDSVYRIVGNRKVISISLIDVLEHIQFRDKLLAQIWKIANNYDAFVLFSVPNGCHRDVGFKHAFGRWDHTLQGILDHTHVTVFNRRSFERLLRSNGFYCVDSNSVKLNRSDQYFPADHPALADGSMLHQFLVHLRDSVDVDGDTNQFVYLSLTGPLSCEYDYVDSMDPLRPFLSIVTRTQGRRLHTFRELMAALAAQTDQDFELIVLAHKVAVREQKEIERVIDDTPAYLRDKIRLILVDSGGRTKPLNVGFGAAEGQYISILDDDDIPFANWVETFKSLSLSQPGKLLRTVAVRQHVQSVKVNNEAGVRSTSAFDKTYPAEFDFFDHILENRTPPVALAFPRALFHELNMQFDESLTTLEDWDYIMRCACIAGVVSSDTVTAIYRWWDHEFSSRSEHDDKEWESNYRYICRKIDNNILLLPRNSSAKIRRLLSENAELRDFVREKSYEEPCDKSRMLADVYDVLFSNSWAVTAPLRFLTSLLGREKVQVGRIPLMQVSELESFYNSLMHSRSWRYTFWMRKIRNNRFFKHHRA